MSLQSGFERLSAAPKGQNSFQVLRIAAWLRAWYLLHPHPEGPSGRYDRRSYPQPHP